MNGKHPAQAAHGTAVGAHRRSLQHRLEALRAGLKAALRAFRPHPNKHPQR
ncbi:hypothetical protein [Thauera sp.]|uniref:hypothetical protein n=1 Tax=unclassified Thauera TaxID=2609274 RepID=UPI002C92DAAF|nr:hypothetical protein [Thauera sp.]HRP22497.1 hypothetical protein [Thauera sp.]HRP66267.1 hypothetical protein [Thauera sp.]